MQINLLVGWAAILAGITAGMVTGMFFHKEDYLGGYGSWSRRLVRLGHISFLGLGLLNICYALTADSTTIPSDTELSSVLLIVGAVTMPTVCYLSSWREGFRNLFAIPVISILVGVAYFLWGLVSN